LSHHGAGQGGVGRLMCSRPRACLQGMTPLSFFQRGGRICEGMGCVG